MRCATRHGSALESGGVERLSLRELAQTLGVSYAAPSHHFQDKEDLLDELRQMAWTRFADALESALAPKAASLREVGQAYVRFALAHPHALQLMFRPSARGPTPQVLTQSQRAWGILLRAVATELGPKRNVGRAQSRCVRGRRLGSGPRPFNALDRRDPAARDERARLRGSVCGPLPSRW
jgi:AcrR family transcriptional regulator